MTNVALIVAAGRGERLGGDVPKQYLPLGGVPVLRHSAMAFAHHPAIDAVRVVVAPEARARHDEAVAGLDLLTPVEGGPSRQASVLNGLESLAKLAPERVLIHDGARPFLHRRTIDAVLDALAHADGALPALAVSDSLKRGSGDGLVQEDVSRNGLWRAQTPQGFRFPAILEAHRRQAGAEHTDDVAVARAAGLTVAMVPGDEGNFKITTAADLARARRLLDAGLADLRVGQGFDVHRFGPGTAVRLCGIDIPHDFALAGHSDADVALHAVTDALLGAIGEGDIGSHFPPSDPQWRGADSAVFMTAAADRLRARGGIVAHVDLTLICEAPKIDPHREAMRERLAGLLGIEPGRVSVKATTTEQLGFTGRREGIAAQAVATVRLPLAE